MEAEDESDPSECPPEGFHSEKKPDAEDAELMRDNDDPPKVVSERVELLREVIEHSRHFISMVKRPEWQSLALDIVSRCVLLIQMDK